MARHAKRDVLLTRLALLRKYLEFYADPVSYTRKSGHKQIGVLSDAGRWARDGLKITAPVEGE